MVKISLNNKFYDIDAVKQAIEDFKDVCDVKIINDSIEVELTPKQEAENLHLEFSNYVLGLIQNK